MQNQPERDTWYEAWAKDQTQKWARFYFAPKLPDEEEQTPEEFWRHWRETLLDKVTDPRTPWDDEKQQLIYKIIDEVQVFLAVVAELSQIIVGEFESIDSWEAQLVAGMDQLRAKAKTLLDKGLAQSQVNNMSWAWMGKSTDQFNEHLQTFIPGIENIASVEHFVKTVANIEWFQPVDNDKMSHTIAKYQQILRVQQQKVSKACIRTMDLFQQKLIEKVRNNEQIDTLEKLHQIYVDANDDAFTELANDAQYLKTSTALCNEYIDLLLTQRRVMATMHRAADSATNDDLDRLVSTVNAMHTELRHAQDTIAMLQEKLNQLEQK